MKKTMAVLAGLVLLLSACNPSEELAEQIIEGQEGVNDVEIDEDSGSVEIETDEGNFSVGSGDIPDGFPIDVPSGYGDLNTADVPGTQSVNAYYPASEYESLVSFYEDWVSANGGEDVSKTETSDPPSVFWTFTIGDDIYAITVGQDSEETFLGLGVTSP